MAALLLTSRKERIFNPRLTDTTCFQDQEVVGRYRFTPEFIRELDTMLRVDLVPKTHRSNAVESVTKVLVGLRYLSKGDFLSEVAYIHGISRSTASVVIDEFIDSVNKRVDNIRFPTERAQLLETKRKFYQKCRLPNIIGAIDGTLIPIKAPTENEAAFVCRKGYHALNIQAVCDADMRFTDVVAKWPGSQHDSAIFNSCSLKDHLEERKPGVLLGDRGYQLKSYLLTPKLHPATAAEEQFNRFHSRGRVPIERAFGVLKSRFRCLHKSGGHLPFKEGKCCRAILASMRLHNLCISQGLPDPPEVDLDNDDDEIIYENLDNHHQNYRQQYINMF